MITSSPSHQIWDRILGALWDQSPPYLSTLDLHLVTDSDSVKRGALSRGGRGVGVGVRVADTEERWSDNAEIEGSK